MFRFITRLYRPTLQGYVLREFATTFALTLLAITLLMLVILAYGLVNELNSFGISVGQVLLLSPFILPKAFVMTLPAATMIATVMVFGRLNAENEIIAAQAGGAKLMTLVSPLIVAGVLICAISLALGHWGTIWGNNQIRSEVLKINKPEFFKNLDRPGNTVSIRPDVKTLIRLNALPIKINAEGKECRPVQIIYFSDNKLGQTILADDHDFIIPDYVEADARGSRTEQTLKAHADATKGKSASTSERALIMRLRNAESFGERSFFADAVDLGVALPDIGASIPIGNSRGDISFIENYQEAVKVEKTEAERWKFFLRRTGDLGAMMASSQVLDASAPGQLAEAWNEAKTHLDNISAAGGALERKRLEYTELHRKLALCTLPLFMIFLGVGLGLLVKKSNRMIGFLLGVALYFLLYYPMSILAGSLSKGGKLSAYAQLPQYLPNVAFLILGLVLWRMYERGTISAMPWLTNLLSGIASAFVFLWKIVWTVCYTIVELPSRLFRRTADRYVGTTFMTPLLIVIMCIGGFYILIDLVDHSNNISEGILQADLPVGDLPRRTQWAALGDLVTYYGIQGLEITLEILPFEVLLAGMLCAMVLVRNQEHLILKSSGVPLQRAARPMVLLTLLVCLGVSAVREIWMPDLIMQREALRPLVYHKGATPSSLALSTIDNGKPILFEMSQYDSALKIGRDLRIYELGNEKNKRIPVVNADVAKWDGRVWVLYMDPVVREQMLAAQGSGTKEPKRKTTSTPQSTELIPGGYVFKTDDHIAPNIDTVKAAISNDLRTVETRKLPMAEWSGPIDPKFIEGERLGANVMRLGDLQRLGVLNPALRVDWYRRISEFLMGMLLLWVALPLMFNDTANTVFSILTSVIVAALYWGLCVFALNYGHAHPELPPWIALIPHGIFFVIGAWHFYFRMKT